MKQAADVRPFRGNRPRSTTELGAWYAATSNEQALEPELPIVDPHHHLFGRPGEAQVYRLEDLQNDLRVGHRVMGTVWVEAYESGWRTSGPQELRSLGEVERIVRTCALPVRTPAGECQVGAAMVSNVDLTLGHRAAEVLDAHVTEAQGRLRGVRHHTTYDSAVVPFMRNAKPQLLSDAVFRRGFACLQRFGLCFDALVFHPQIGEVADLADAFPQTPIVLNHVGILLGIAEHAARRPSSVGEWQRSMRALSKRPNVRVKVGGMGMPVFGFGFEAGPRPATSQALLEAWRPFIDICIDAFGTQRCMFESNFPVDQQSCGYAELWNAFKLASRPFSVEERRDLFYRTACRTYGLPELEQACDAAWRPDNEGDTA